MYIYRRQANVNLMNKKKKNVHGKRNRCWTFQPNIFIPSMIVGTINLYTSTTVQGMRSFGEYSYSAFPSYISGFTISGESFAHVTAFLIQPLRLSHSIFMDGACWVCFCCQHYNNNNNNNHIQRRYSRFFTISSRRRELSPTRTLKWPGLNRVQTTCNTSNAYHVQVSGTKGQLSY